MDNQEHITKFRVTIEAEAGDKTYTRVVSCNPHRVKGEDFADMIADALLEIIDENGCM